MESLGPEALPHTLYWGKITDGKGFDTKITTLFTGFSGAEFWQKALLPTKIVQKIKILAFPIILPGALYVNLRSYWLHRFIC